MKIFLKIVIICFVGCICSHQVLCQIDFSKDRNTLEFDSLFAGALKQKLWGNYSQAEELLLGSLKAKPLLPAVYYELSRVYLSMNRNGEAISAGLAAVRYDKSNEWYLLHVSKIYQIIGKKDSSLFFHELVVKLKPDKYEYKIRLAQLYYENQYFNRSLKVLKRLEHEYGLLNEIFFARYKNYLALNNNERCLETLKSALKKFPYETRYIGLLAEHYASMGKSDLALSYYNELLKLDPNNERAYLSLIDFYRNVGRQSEALVISKKFIFNSDFSFNNKIEILTSYLNDNKSFNSLKPELKNLLDSVVNYDPENSKSYLLESKFFLKDNKFNKALEVLESGIRKFGSDASILEQLLYVLSLKNDFDLMLSYAIDGISLHNDNPIIYLYGGIASYRLQRFSESLNLLNTGVRYTKGSRNLLVKYYSYLGEVYHATKDYSKSDMFFQSSLEIDPYNLVVLNNYSYYLSLRNEQLEKALTYIKRCISMEPKNYLFLDTYAWILFKQGKALQAMKKLDDAFALGGMNRPALLEHYCLILLALKKKDEAFKYYYKLKIAGKASEQMKAIFDFKE